MATIHELLKHVSDEKLRAALEKEVQRLSRQKKFGLVFEEHLPEATPLHGIRIKVGATVVTAAQDGGALYTVKSIAGGVATCVPQIAA